jgi:pantothenate kinase
LIGIVGKPGSGKSTLARALVNAIGDSAELLPMDGFHLSNAVLEELGISDRKGAPHTFDTYGYVTLLNRIRNERTHPIYYPVFDRSIEESIAAQGVVKPTTQLVVTEGNYLLLDNGGWERVRPLLDETWFVDVNDYLRLERLIARHIHFGRSPAAAEAWARRTDELNAHVVGESRERADVCIDLEELRLE